MKHLLGIALSVILVAAPVAFADDEVTPWGHTLAELNADTSASGAPADSWLAATEKAAAEADATAAKAPAPQGDGPPLPLHTIEGVGGALAVPMAYLVNPGPEGTVIGVPAVSMTYLNLGGDKYVNILAVTETICRRIELGYALSRFDLGNLPQVIKKAGRAIGLPLRIHRHDVYLHNFNARALLIEENTKFLGIPLPSVTAGIQAKVNCGIQDINHSLRLPDGTHLVNSIGLERSNGIDYVLTASKMFPTLMFGRPLILTAGMRNSKASNFGYLGFGDSCATTVEADAVCLITDWLAVGYEFRQRTDPYDKLPPVHLGEDNFHAIRAAVILGPNMTLAGGWAYLGHVGNALVDGAWGIQFKYEF